MTLIVKFWVCRLVHGPAHSVKPALSESGPGNARRDEITGKVTTNRTGDIGNSRSFISHKHHVVAVVTEPVTVAPAVRSLRTF